MESRRTFMEKAALGGIAGIVAAKTAPAFAQQMGIVKIGQLGLGSHGFLGSFVNPPSDWKGKVKCRPYIVWDDEPGVADVLKKSIGFERVAADPEQLVKECDAVHVEHADYRRALELARPALEAGKPVFINRPFAATIADSEEIIRLAKAWNAPVMSASSLEFQPEIAEMQKFAQEKGPVRAYEAYCPEPHFTWHFPHVINYAHAALGGGIESAYFTGDFIMDLTPWLDDKKALGCSLVVLTYKPREGQPPLVGMNHVGNYPGTYHIDVFGMGENKTFAAGAKLFDYMFEALHEFYVNRKIPRPYEAILEQHRALVAANVSRMTGRAVRLDSLGGDDALPWSTAIRNWLFRYYKVKK
ncbi:MAG: Gfo/Idh/MocA family protein [Candidatus Latescibacterota bacterium]